MDSISAPLTYESLIKAQQQAADMQGSRAPSSPASDDRSQGRVSARAEDEFARHIQAPAGRGAQNARTGGAMPVWSPSAAEAAGLAHGFAPQASDDLRVEDFFAEGEAAETGHNGGGLARKYTRDTNPEYADVSIGDFVDIINPLHHIPLVSTLYREITGDEIKPPARILGGGIYGGPIGMASSMVNAVVEDQTGRDIGDNVVSMFKGGDHAGIKGFNGNDVSSAALRAGNAPMSYDQAKAVYAKRDNLDMDWGASAPAAEAMDNDAAIHFFNDDAAKADIETYLNEGVDAGQAAAAPSEYARAFGPGQFNAAGHGRAARAYGDARTSGAMPEYSPETVSLKPKTELAEQLRMDNPAAREPVTQISFD